MGVKADTDAPLKIFKLALAIIVYLEKCRETSFSNVSVPTQVLTASDSIACYSTWLSQKFKSIPRPALPIASGRLRDNLECAKLVSLAAKI